MKGRHIALEAVLIRNITLPDAIQEAITTKLEAEQQALKMKYVIDEAAAEAQKKLLEVKADIERKKLASEASAEAGRVEAKGIADATMLRAKADSDAKELDGKATAEYERSVQAFLTPQILQLRQIEAANTLAGSTNTKFVLMGAGHSLLDLRGLFGGAKSEPYP